MSVPKIPRPFMRVLLAEMRARHLRIAHTRRFEALWFRHGGLPKVIPVKLADLMKCAARAQFVLERRFAIVAKRLDSDSGARS